MRARINSTGRQRIRRGMATFTVDSEAHSGRFAAFLKLDPLNLPGDAEVVVEAYRQSLSERFRFGTVAKPVPLDQCVLKDLDVDEVAFRVKVIERDSGRVLARGDAFAPSEGEDSGRRPLLKLVVRPLGNQPWMVERAGAGVQLVLNSRIEEAEKRIQADPSFRALILPAALRMVLLMLWGEDAQQSEEEDDDGHALWFRFAEDLGCAAPESLGDDTEATREWIDAVCSAFCDRQDFAGMIAGGEEVQH